MKKYKVTGQVVVEEEKIVSALQVVEKDEYIVDAPNKKYLLTRRDKERIAWFEACKLKNSEEQKTDLEFIQKNKKLFLMETDDRFNDIMHNVFKGFTGLMYAVYTDNIQAVKILLADEGMITTTSKNVIFAKNN